MRYSNNDEWNFVVDVFLMLSVFCEIFDCLKEIFDIESFLVVVFYFEISVDLDCGVSECCWFYG